MRLIMDAACKYWTNITISFESCKANVPGYAVFNSNLSER